MENNYGYFFSSNEIVRNSNYFKDNLNCATLFYSLKANSEKSLLKIIKNQGIGFEVASIEELKQTIQIGCQMSKVIFGLPVVSSKIIKEAYKCGCSYFVFDCLEGFDRLVKNAPESKKILRIYISDILDRCIPFGIKIEDLLDESFRKILKFVDGVSFHITTNNSIEDFKKIMSRIEMVIQEIRKKRKKKLILNIGGGFTTRKDKDLLTSINEVLCTFAVNYNLDILAEPGRSIINSAGIYKAEVVLVKEYETYSDVYVEAGEPHGISFTQKIILSNGHGTKKISRIVSAICTHEVLGIKKLSKNIKEGDCIVFQNCGAYTLCMSNNFHLWKKPNITLVKDFY